MIASDSGGDDSFELECRDFGKKNIVVNDGLLYFSRKQTDQFISNKRGQGDKPDCQKEIKQFEGITRNFTYSLNFECSTQLVYLNNNNGDIVLKL